MIISGLMPSLRRLYFESTHWKCMFFIVLIFRDVDFLRIVLLCSHNKVNLLVSVVWLVGSKFLLLISQTDYGGWFNISHVS